MGDHAGAAVAQRRRRPLGEEADEPQEGAHHRRVVGAAAAGEDGPRRIGGEHPRLAPVAAGEVVIVGSDGDDAD